MAASLNAKTFGQLIDPFEGQSDLRQGFYAHRSIRKLHSMMIRFALCALCDFLRSLDLPLTRMCLKPQEKWQSD